MTYHIRDGSYLTTAGGLRHRVFSPRWWQVWRWVVWWRARSRGWVTVSTTDGTLRVRIMEVESEYESHR